MEHEISQLRHLYANMVGGVVKDSAAAKRIAEGLLAPVIERLELAAPQQAPYVFKGGMSAEDQSIELDAGFHAQNYCRAKFGAARGHADWRRYHDAFVAGYIDAVRRTMEAQAKQIEALQADANRMIKAPARWLPAEIEDGYRGIRWVTSDGVHGVPTPSDYISYMTMIGKQDELDTLYTQTKQVEALNQEHISLCSEPMKVEAQCEQAKCDTSKFCSSVQRCTARDADRAKKGSEE